MSILAIAWEPEIRGLLTVIIAVTVLCGSIYLIMATNMGARLAFLVTLAVFRLLEDRIPTYFHARLRMRFTGPAPDERRQRARLGEHGFAVASVSRRRDGDAELLEYQVTLRARQVDSVDQFATRIASLPEVVEYEVSPVYD